METNLGGGTEKISLFRQPDLIADADGWLIGRDVRAGASFSTSMGTLLQQHPNWEDRVAIFLRERFTQTGKTLNTSIQQNIESIYVNWPWQAYARDQFAQGQKDPTPDTELPEFATACAKTLLSRAGLAATS